MVGKRINKLRFSLKVFFFVAFLYASILFVCYKEFVEEEYCDPEVCVEREEAEGFDALWDDFVATFCMYPDCDRS